MIKSVPRLHLAAAASCILLLAGCQTVSDELEQVNLTRTPLDAHPIAVSEARMDLSVAVPAGGTGLSPADAARISAFAAQYSRVGHGPVVLSVPAGGASGAGASTAAAQVRSLLYAGGVDWDRVAGGTYDASSVADAPITLSFVKYDAKGPDCPSLASIDLRKTNDNLPHAGFGCSTSSNLAAVIADPRDLLGDRTLDPVDAATRARVTKGYRDGTIKAPPSASATGGN